MSYDSVVLATTGLVSYWALREDATYLGTHSQLFPDSKSGHGALLNNPLDAYAQSGPASSAKSVLYGTTPNGWLTATYNTDFVVTGNFSIEVWIKTTSVLPNLGLVDRKAYYTSSGYSLRLDSGVAQLFPGDGNWYGSTSTLNDGVWHQIVGVLSGTSVLIYVDGVLVSTSTGITADPNVAASLDFTIGQYAIFHSTNTVDTYRGYLSSVSFYNVAISATDVLNHYNAMIPNLARTISQSLTFTQTVTPHQSKYVRSLSQSLSFTQIVLDLSSLYIPQNITFTQTLTRHLKRNRAFSQSLTFTQIVSPKKNYRKILSQNLSLSQLLTFRKVKLRKVTQRLTFTQTLHVNKVKKVVLSDRLSFRDGARTNKSLNIPITQVLLFRGGGGYGTSSSAITKTVDGKTFTYSDVVAIKVVNYITLTGNTVIVLPSPLFGDSKTNVASMTPLRMVDGTIYTYIKTTRRQRLTYRFELKRQKAAELQQFLDDNDLLWLIMNDFKGVQWYVRIVNNPTIFTATGRGYVCPNNREVHQIELQFEGFQISGNAISC